MTVSKVRKIVLASTVFCTMLSLAALAATEGASGAFAHLLMEQIVPEFSYLIARYDGPAEVTDTGRVRTARLTVLEVVSGNLKRIEYDADAFIKYVHGLTKDATGEPNSKAEGLEVRCKNNVEGFSKNKSPKLILPCVLITVTTHSSTPLVEFVDMPRPGTRLIIALAKGGWFYDLANRQLVASLRKKIKSARSKIKTSDR